MNAFTIDADNNITIHPTRKAARETDGGVFDTAETLAELIGPDNKRLVEIWNSLTGVTPVNRSSSTKLWCETIPLLSKTANQFELSTEAPTSAADQSDSQKT